MFRKNGVTSFDGWTPQFSKHDLGGGELQRHVPRRERRARSALRQVVEVRRRVRAHVLQGPVLYYRIAAEYRSWENRSRPGPVGVSRRTTAWMPLHSPHPKTMAEGTRTFRSRLRSLNSILGGLGDVPAAHHPQPLHARHQRRHERQAMHYRALHQPRRRPTTAIQWVRVEVELFRGWMSRVRHMIDGVTVLELHEAAGIGGGAVAPVDPAVKIDGTPLTGGYISIQAEKRRRPTSGRLKSSISRAAWIPKASNFKLYFVKSNPQMCK